MTRDPQLQLLDPARTTTAECPVCHATRHPHETRAPTCAYERDRENLGTRTRPRACLNTPDPASDPFPDGF